MSIRIIEENCTGCKLCQTACLFGAVEIVDGLAVVGEGCTLCGACAEACKFEAIQVERPVLDQADLAAGHKGIFVFAEQRRGRLSDSALELLGEGTRLAAETKEPLAAVILGHGVEPLCQTLIEYGANKVFLADDESLADYRTESYTAVLTAVCGKEKPSIFLFGATTMGRDLAPRLAARLEVGLTADCTALALEPETGLLLQTRPAWGGNIMATIKTARHRPQMATVRPKVMSPARPQPGREGLVERLPVKIDPRGFKVKVLEFRPREDQDKGLDKAQLVVSGGRGLGNAEGFALLEELARLLDGAVGASRPVIDAGWRDHSCQVGQTGRTVAPKVYLACGISGAVQHRVGMENSGLVIALNKDPDAAMMKSADFAATGDLFQVLPALIEELKSRLNTGSARVER
jgi:caffeyl-CoA reductase-Etf complex subunit CarE